MKSLPVDPFYAGLSGLQLPVPQYMYPPAFENASRLEYYSSLMNSIEINSSFYKIPQVRTVMKWADTVTSNFKFTFKLWKGITHNKGLLFKQEDVEAFFFSISAIKEKKGCVLIQFPPGLGKESSFQLDLLLRSINEVNTSQGWNVAVEFRNRSWYHEDIYALLQLYGAAIVIHDIPKSATPVLLHATDFIYLRFHGPTGNYRDSYTNEFLEEYGTYVQEWIEEGKTIYAYFNNTMGDAFNNAQYLKSVI